MDYKGTVARCKLTNGPRVRSDPATGCSAWVREPGTDDEPGPPSGLEFVNIIGSKS